MSQATKAFITRSTDINISQEENRLKAKALRDRYIASQQADGTAEPLNRTPSGFIANGDISSAGRKRSHASISTSNVPETSRDGRQNAGSSSSGGSGRTTADNSIQAARKFTKYVDYNFSKMTDTKGGFLTAEDDPFNKALHAATKDAEKPAHMTLKEWERHQLLKSLRSQRAGPFEPGLSVMGNNDVKCRECGSVEIDWQWEEVFKCRVCNGCKEKLPEKYSLLTKTEAKEDYLLTDRKFSSAYSVPSLGIRELMLMLSWVAELKDPELLPHLNKPNPHKSHWHDMMLFLRYQVEDYAFKTKWGSAEALDAEFEKRETEKKKRKEDKFKAKLQELKKKTRTEAYRRNMKSGGKSGGQFGDAIGSGRHEHDWGQTVENEDGISVKTCVECGMEVEELEF